MFYLTAVIITEGRLRVTLCAIKVDYMPTTKCAVSAALCTTRQQTSGIHSAQQRPGHLEVKFMPRYVYRLARLCYRTAHSIAFISFYIAKTPAVFSRRKKVTKARVKGSGSGCAATNVHVVEKVDRRSLSNGTAQYKHGRKGHQQGHRVETGFIQRTRIYLRQEKLFWIG